MDEACDCSNTEQAAIVLRFVDSHFQVREEFLGFNGCDSGTKGRDLADLLFEQLNNWGLTLL